MNINGLKTASIAMCTVIITGCASTGSESDKSMVTSNNDSMVELQTAQRRVAELESELSARDASASATDMTAMSEKSGGTSVAENSLFPPNPKVGECYARVLIPASYQTVSDQVLKSEASDRFDIMPAQYETVEERVLVNEASTRLEVIPAVYETVDERILVRAASTKIVEVPAEYDTVTEQVIDKPAHTIWKTGPAATQAASVLSERTNDTGEIMCLVEVPATYKMISKRVLVRPASTQVVDIPAEYKTVTKQVVKTPATTRELSIPAQYDTVKVSKMTMPAKERRIEIPAEYSVVSRTEKISEESMEWRRVVCEVNLTRPKVAKLQKALADKGYYKIAVDGIIGPHTLTAAKQYALANELPAGSNYISVKVVDALDLDI